MNSKKFFLIQILIGLLIFTNNVHSASNVWDVMRSQFKMDHALSEVAVQSELRWLRSHPGYFEQLGRAKPYIYHIVNEIKKRNLPGELALIPLIESAYDPFA